MREENNTLLQKITYLQWLLHAYHKQTHTQHDPTSNPMRGQGRVLALLQMQDGLSTKELSYMLGIRIASLNELLAKMEKAEFITREPAEEDKRIMLIRLTEKGRTHKREKKDTSALFACLNNEEQVQLEELLSRIITAMEEKTGDNYGEDAAHWMQAARERMGAEQFDKLFAMRRGFGGCGKHGKEHHHDEECGCGGHHGKGGHGHHGDGHHHGGGHGHHGDGHHHGGGHRHHGDSHHCEGGHGHPYHAEEEENTQTGE